MLSIECPVSIDEHSETGISGGGTALLSNDATVQNSPEGIRMVGGGPAQIVGASRW